MAFPSKKDEDLFNQSSMSFGEHLSELRRCLINSILWLTCTFTIALIPLGPYPSMSSLVIDYIQHPLTKSLESFYKTQTEKRFSREKDYLKEIGFQGDIKEIIDKYNMTAEEYWIFPGQNNLLIDTKGKPVDLPPTMTPVGNPGNPNAKSTDSTVKSDTQEKNPTTVQSNSLPQPQRVLLWKKTSDDSRLKTKALNIPESFVIFLKGAVFLAILFASPGIFYNFWSFVAAGLYSRERKLVYRFLPLSLGLFLAGFCMAFFVVFEMVLTFLLKFNAAMNIDPDPRISEWLNLALLFPIGFGIAFQLPLLMFALCRLRIFTFEQYWAHWKVSVLIISFISMMLTPPDPWSFVCLFSSVIVLYFGGILLCKAFPPPKRAFDDEEEDDEDDVKKLTESENGKKDEVDTNSETTESDDSQSDSVKSDASEKSNSESSSSDKSE